MCLYLPTVLQSLAGLEKATSKSVWPHKARRWKICICADFFKCRSHQPAQNMCEDNCLLTVQILWSYNPKDGAWRLCSAKRRSEGNGGGGHKLHSGCKINDAWSNYKYWKKRALWSFLTGSCGGSSNNEALVCLSRSRAFDPCPEGNLYQKMKLGYTSTNITQSIKISRGGCHSTAGCTTKSAKDWSCLVPLEL